MKLIQTIKQDEELASQLLELDESEHLEVELKRLLNLNNMADNIDKYVYVLQAIESRILFFKDQKKQLDQFIKTMEYRQKSFKDILTNELSANNVKEAIGVYKKLTLQSIEALVIDESKLDKKYKKEIISTEIDRDLIESDLQKNIAVEGVSTRKTEFIRHYNNSSTKTALLIRKEEKKDDN